MSGPVVVVGIGADGWDGLPDPARREIQACEVLMGSARQLALLPETGAERVVWPSPMLPAVRGLLAEREDRAVCVLASGDPMLHGVGTTLARMLGPERVRVLPHPSSVSLACARMGWPVEDTRVVSLVGRPVELVNRVLHPAARVLVLSAGADSPARVARLLASRGYGASAMTVLERLGGPAERLVTGTAAKWDAVVDPLNVVALECRADPGVTALPGVPGLPDEAFEHDGQLTKREVRAVTLSCLAPLPGQVLWDVGAGAGSVAIEWMRVHPACRAVAVEARADRATRIARNADALGVPTLRVVTGAAPEALAGLEAPDAVFVGGGATVPGVLETCWDVLGGGGRLVVNAVTVESEAVLAAWHARHGGDLLRLSVHRAGPVGGFTAWHPAMPVTIWTAVRP
ncbi:precorrin-6y C5,15-methyltransferase (decarboxylating) subunit CbiE [Sphaerisporangium album]|uniref:Precorrin-6y C5,15-methyltransferase (Decarboxylating) subunit CbiE n=1 Tax=Sphaerisporangium album TaxID=509200 RepID=A0A367EXC5_9ACTN|nr:precorrin-6y C5,15-methyltransferase (decarboxylating) subunit CbiE [Sphaerisporangium album]RCG22778.1 precorrin-6y C5,15-methyltransferase (decarboxylating) subunit CbiE [Sphaerisporangium album]